MKLYAVLLTVQQSSKNCRDSEYFGYITQVMNSFSHSEVPVICHFAMMMLSSIAQLALYIFIKKINDAVN